MTQPPPDAATLALKTLEQMANLPCADMVIWDAHANAVQSLATALVTAALKAIQAKESGNG